MKHQRRIWIVFAICLAVVCAAMGWASFTVVRLERAQRVAEESAQREELVRLALWRMDAALTTVVAQEGAHPHFHYRPFYSATDAYTRGLRDVGERGVMVPSPLIKAASPLVKLYFRMDHEGKVTSPQAPTGRALNLAVPTYVSPQSVRRAVQRLVVLQESLVGRQLLDSLPQLPPSRATFNNALLANTNKKVSNFDVSRRRINEFNSRDNVFTQFDMFNGNSLLVLEDKRVRSGLARSVWVGGELVLARRVAVGAETSVVGCWLDWNTMRQWLLDSVKDLLPEASLKPIGPKANSAEHGRLATLPVYLAPGAVPVDPTTAAGTAGVLLATAWAGLLLAAGAVGMLMRGALSLSERRGAFVSAVTHELRTPLTTLRMYTEMLSEGMVADPDRKDQYLNTIHSETNRLCRLVENVLAHSRLEGPAKGATFKPIEITQWFDQIIPRLKPRAEQAGMSLVTSTAPDADHAQVAADPTALDQILSNLIDNACKYACGADDKRIHVELDRTDSHVRVRVRDHGSGVAPQDREKIFRPFVRSDRDAGGASGGLGLGLSISRRLARSMDGDLLLEHRQQACFTLTLPVAR